jgi:hypothetical protein
LNAKIKNAEQMFFDIFTSPITTYTDRKGKEDLLAGNLFSKTKFSHLLYKSLLETAAVHPKKKHLKKIISHIIQTEKPEDLDP